TLAWRSAWTFPSTVTPDARNVALERTSMFPSTLVPLSVHVVPDSTIRSPPTVLPTLAHAVDVGVVVDVVEVLDVGGGGWIGVSPSARVRNEAIWPRVTRSSGQNRSFWGGLQPRVTSAAASAWISASKMEPSSSSNLSSLEAGRCRARTRKAAI